MAANGTSNNGGQVYASTNVTNPPVGGGNPAPQGAPVARGTISSGQTNAGTATDTSAAATWLPQGS